MKIQDVTAKDRRKAKPGEEERIQSAIVKPDNSGTMQNIGGSKSNDWNKVIIDQALNTVWATSDEQMRGRQVNATVAFMVQTKPGDELEAMMAAQLFAAHNAAMECYRRAMIPAQPMQARSENLNQANKLSRTFATLSEALNRHRGKSSQQKVTVEHVHVYEGGQAVVGVVNPTATGGGVANNSKDQSHGTESTSTEPAMLCANPLGNVLPISSHAERPMPAARRKESRRAEG